LRVGSLPLNPLHKGNATEYLAHGGGMNPDRSFTGTTGKKSNSIQQAFSERSLEEASTKEIGREEDEKKGPDKIVELVDHRTTEVISGMRNKSEIRISKSETNSNIETPNGHRAVLSCIY
jgi:hypothetical protein